LHEWQPLSCTLKDVLVTASVFGHPVAKTLPQNETKQRQTATGNLDE